MVTHYSITVTVWPLNKGSPVLITNQSVPELIAVNNNNYNNTQIVFVNINALSESDRRLVETTRDVRAS